jgi:PAS domain S-box-containing protein
MLVVDRDGRIVLANRWVEQAFGYDADELMRIGVDDLVPSEFRDGHAGHRAAYFGDPVARPLGVGRDLAAQHRDGSLFPIEISLSPAEVNGGLHAIVHIVDITERKKLEQQLLQREKVEAIGRLAGGMAHDFNNMLTAISGYGQLLLADLDPDDRRRSDAEAILQASTSATALTSQLLAFGRREELQLRVVDLAGLIAEIEPILRRLIGERIAIRTKAPAGVGHVRGDPGQLRQVILNLALNARDAMPDSGTLTVELANVELGEDYARHHPEVTPGRHVVLAVSDTGIGIDEETRMRIFEPFFTTKPRGQGTGLGLATVQTIVQRAGGHIWVYSEPGHGTTFKIYLPRTDAPALLETVAAPAPIRRGTETVLVVEDDSVVRQLVATVLERHGYRVLQATGGGEALDLADRHDGQVHLLVSDVMMPGLDARTLAERLAAAQPGLAVLYMTGYTEEALGPYRLLEPGAAVLEKPFMADTLLRRVRELLDAAVP